MNSFERYLRKPLRQRNCRGDRRTDTDDAADLIGELPEDRQERVTSQISDTGHAEDIRELLPMTRIPLDDGQRISKSDEGLSVLKCLNSMRTREVTWFTPFM